MPSLTYPHWNGTFAQTDDWAHQSLYNMFLAATWERLLVTGAMGNQPSYPAGGGPSPTTTPPVSPPRPPKVQLYSAGPPPVKATDVQGTASAMPTFVAPLTFVGVRQMQGLSVAEMQQAIVAMVQIGTWTDPTFVLAGVAPAGTLNYPPPGLVMTVQQLASLAGVAPPPAVSGVVSYYPFNRKRFRQIFSATSNTKSNQWYGGTGGDWDLALAPAAVAGMKAILLDGGNAIAVPGTGLIAGSSGRYKGVYIYQGGGTWTASTNPADVPDLLSSTETPGSNNYCAPHWQQHGDLFGPWIWTDLRNCLNYLTRSIIGFGQNSFNATPAASSNLAAPYSGPGAYDTITAADPSVGALYSTPAAAMAAVDAIWPGTPAAIGAGSVVTPDINFGASYSFSGGTGGYGASIADCSCRFGSAGVYLGRAVAMDTYLLATDRSGAWSPYDANGTGLPNGTWALFDTTALSGSGGDIFGEAIGTTVFGGTKPDWPAVAGASASTGMSVEGVIILLRWDVTGGFAFTTATP